MGKLEEEKVEQILSSVQNLQFGSIVITIHDGEITQVETTEKKRFPMLKRSNLKAEQFLFQGYSIEYPF